MLKLASKQHLQLARGFFFFFILAKSDFLLALTIWHRQIKLGQTGVDWLGVFQLRRQRTNRS